MKKALIFLFLSMVATLSVQAQGTILFNNNNITKISTNAVVGGAATGLTGTNGIRYYYALYCSTTATSVNGQTSAISGGSSVNYAFNDGNWTLVAYGTNASLAGRLTSDSANSSFETIVSGVAGGTSAQFVVIGWSANIGSDITSVQSWFGMGDPVFPGWIGQSVVSGPIVLGTHGITTFATLFGTIPPYIQGFTLGMAGETLPNTPPYITSQPTNVTVTAGASASFSVTAVGNPPPMYQWIINGTNINGATSYTLTITNVQLVNAGSYSVCVSNSAGSTSSFPAVLTVQSITGAQPGIVSQPSDLTVQAGGNATFTVGVNGSTPLSYQWSFNSNAIVGATNVSLTLVGVQTNNAGNYAVMISNSYGITNSSAAILAVQNTQPVITLQPQSLIVAAGGGAAFAVGITGSTPFNYQWSFNGTNIVGATNGSLTLTGVQPANAGSYIVSISNAYGATNSVAATLTVSTSPIAGYVFFFNFNTTATKIFTNSAVGGTATGLTTTNGGLYCYALYASATATSVNGQTSSIVGSTSINYAFSDTNWTLVAYGTNSLIKGRFFSSSSDNMSQTAVPGFAGGTAAQFVVIGWSASIGTDIATVQAWFNGGNPVSDGWIGQSSVSGAITMGNGTSIPAALLFGQYPPDLHGFVLGLASPNPSASYVVPYSPPAILQTKLSGGRLQLSWAAAAGTFGVQSNSSPFGQWGDTRLTVTSDGTNSSVTVPAGWGPYFRLVTQ